MKSIFKLISVGLSIFLLGSCYQKAREPLPDDGSGISNYSKWDWSGEAPLSYFIDGASYKPINPTIEKMGMNSPIPRLNITISSSIPEENVTISNILSINPKIPTGIHVATTLNNLDFSFGMFHIVNMYPKTYQTKKVIVKITKNNDTEIEGYFYGKIFSENPYTERTIENGYFKIDKTGTTWIN
jgi:hypothetical protein